MDAKLLAAVDAIRMDDALLEPIRRHLSSAPYPVARDALLLILAHRSQHIVGEIPRWNTIQDKTGIMLVDMAIDVTSLTCAENRGDPDLHRMLRIVDAFCDAIPGDSTNPDIKRLYNRIFDCLAQEVLPSPYATNRVEHVACRLLCKLASNAPTLLETKPDGKPLSVMPAC